MPCSARRDEAWPCLRAADCLDASDIHYCNAYEQFTGPDGRPYIWGYLASSAEWTVAVQTRDPTTYAAILALNMGCDPGCPCTPMTDE
jgi:hypothetical protein